jgi:surfeit locus 1 family protein
LVSVCARDFCGAGVSGGQGGGRRWLPVVLVWVTLAVLVSLGFWQLDRADQKRRLSEDYAKRARSAVVTLGDQRVDVEAWRFRRVRVAGAFEGAHQYLLDNQVHKGVAGYHVVTPFRLEDGSRVVLVDRGWVPQGADRSQLPSIALASSTHRLLDAMVTYFPQPGLRIGLADGGATGWPRVIEYFDLAAMEQQLGADVLPFLLLLDPDEAGGFVREWAPAATRIGPERHEAYAAQWFALAFALLTLYLIARARSRDEDRYGSD